MYRTYVHNKGSSSFSGANRKLSPMQKRVQKKMSENNSSLESSGLSRNHKELSKDLQFIEKQTRLRRAEPLYPSLALGDSYKYGGKQFERKAPRHLTDFNISTENKTLEEMATEYKDLVESLLSKSGLVVHNDGTLNKQEPTINIGDPESRGIVSFENNPLYEDHHFITSYPISKEAFDNFKETGNIGSSPEERREERRKMLNEFQRIRAKKERERAAAQSFYSTLPEDARMANPQLREVESLKDHLEKDPSFPITKEQKAMIERADRYYQYKTKFDQNNPDIDRDL